MFIKFSSFSPSFDWMHQYVAMMIQDHFSSSVHWYLLTSEKNMKCTEQISPITSLLRVVGRNKLQGIAKKESKSYWVESDRLFWYQIINQNGSTAWLILQCISYGRHNISNVQFLGGIIQHQGANHSHYHKSVCESTMWWRVNIMFALMSIMPGLVLKW